MRFITTKSFMPFVIYRILLGIVIFALVWSGALSPHAGEIRWLNRGLTGSTEDLALYRENFRCRLPESIP
ncbi:hypothetical protein AB0E21_23865 [Streptomyces sp. NPDC047967]|uniref:hypothetical protein n=1 Tax=unclassified Streptomyces TaxID=2593676 RepID=UPI001C0B9D23|nr:hypothetical protein [Streptomyces sp. YPW6]QWQ45932.1 hypothetical protein KME66_30285 [Streptomyces sp. YPW6]